MQEAAQTFCKKCGCVLASSSCFHSCAIHRAQLISRLQSKVEKLFAKRTLIAQHYNELLGSYGSLKQQNREKREGLQAQLNELRAQNEIAFIRVEKDQLKKKQLRQDKRKELKLSKSKQGSEISSESRSTHNPKEYENHRDFNNPQPASSYYGGYDQGYVHPNQPQASNIPILRNEPLPMEEEENIWGAPTGGLQEEEKSHSSSKKYYGRVEMGEELEDDFSHAPPDAKVKNSFRKKLSNYAFQEKITELLKYPEKQPIDFVVNSICEALDFELNKGRVIGTLMVCNLKKMAMMEITEDLEDIVDSNKLLGSVGKSQDGSSMVCFWLAKKADFKKILKKYSIFDSYLENWKITETNKKKELTKWMWQYWGDKLKTKEYSYFKLILL